jgi:P27 family predicted phage terminase small subunit
VAQPTALRVLNGNPANRPLPKGEPIPPSGMPPCPSSLSSEAQRVWRSMAAKLHRTHLLTSIDGNAFECYCIALATLRKAQAVLDKKGFTVTTENGYEQQRPEVAIARQALESVRRYSAEFGLTPAARARISLPALEGEEDDAAGILS